ncbi:hypothetical protein DFH07DRAFT_973130 [Mycena maculata]|uniref:Uncharacterized protein n=1 Tax=Mycena maculata TaxID=230809 RepID=A0AAD7MIZ0_9AGAR|nr:hypothetical protein DFH07DRAFT_973130 [Mycena maculata]
MSSAHPPDPMARSDINSFVQNLRHAGKVKGAAPSSTSQTKSSLSDAELETNAGLRPKGQKRKTTQTRTDREPEGSSKRSRVEESQLKAMKEKLGKKIPIQKLVFLPDGINGNGNLNRTKLTTTYLDLLLTYKLAKLSTPTDQLFVHPGWSNAQLCDWVEGHFPEAIEYLSTHPYAADADASEAVRGQVWRLCIKTHQQLDLSFEALPTGATVINVCASAGRAVQQRVLILTSKLRVSTVRYTDWDGESDHNSSDYVLSEEEEDELESADSNTKGLKGKGKGKAAIKGEQRTSVAPARASGRSTRLSTGAITWNEDVLIDVLDSDEEEFPEALATTDFSSISSNTVVNVNASGVTSANTTVSGSATNAVMSSSSSNVGVSSSSSNAVASGSSNTFLTPFISSQSPLFGSFRTPSPPAEDNDPTTFLSNWPPGPSVVESPNNSRWAAALIAASEGGAKPGSAYNTLPDAWA